MDMIPLCLMEDVRKTYRIGEQEVEVLKGIDLRIEAGEFVAIMGSSGSGKTTLMNLLGCLDVPTAGRYELAGSELTHLTDDELSVIRNEHIGFVFQNFYLLPYATVLENVLLPTLYVEKQMNASAEKKALQFLELVGLQDRAKFRPNQLSGGQQQRVAIARALINEPQLVLADEPTGMLDSTTAGEIMKLLALLEKRGKTIVVVTHDPNIAAYAKRCIQIKDGVMI